VPQVHKGLHDIDNLAGCTLAKTGECSEWTSILNSRDENRADVCKNLEGKPFSSILDDLNKVIVNDKNAVLKDKVVY
jgi:hypothetical protein